jgi:hypothetical protein
VHDDLQPGAEYDLRGDWGPFSCRFHHVGYLVRTRVRSSVIRIDRARDVG